MKYRFTSPIVKFHNLLKSLILLCIVLLAKLCQEIWQKESWSLDTKILVTIHQWASPALDRIMLSVTSLGDPEFVVIIVVLSTGLLLWQRRFPEIKILILACAGALILNQGMKLVFTRPRPTLWPSLLHETSFGFPSGHAIGSIVLYGLLAYFHTTHRPHYAKGVYACSILLIGLIGFSRLYLGVHYPTDIIAGYITGWLWLITCIGLLRIQKTGTATFDKP